MLVLTYRDDEISANHPLRIVIGDLSTVGSVRRMKLPPLSRNAMRQLADGTHIDHLSDETFYKGSRELRIFGLVDMDRKLQGEVHDFKRLRNIYKLDLSNLPLSPPEVWVPLEHS